MFGLKKKKRIEEEEEYGCAFCSYAQTGNGNIFCTKKKKNRQAEENCPSYEFDLLKHRPGVLPRFEALNPEAAEEFKDLVKPRNTEKGENT